MACTECYRYRSVAEHEANAGYEARRKLKELREAAAAVIARNRPHYNGNRVVGGEAMRRLREVVEMVEGKDATGATANLD